jgi:hypothetical protein
MQVKVRNYNLIGDTTKQIGVDCSRVGNCVSCNGCETPDKDAEGNDLGTTTKAVKVQRVCSYAYQSHCKNNKQSLNHSKPA